MRRKNFKASLKCAILAVSAFLFGINQIHAQTINLTAAPTTATMPDGTVVPMWGYTCGASTGTANCRAANPASTGWSPVIITVNAPVMTPPSLTVNLTNNLIFMPGNNKVPTSLVIVGQLGGGLGKPTTVASPAHADLGVSWPVATTPPMGPEFTPPAQSPRVQSFGTEVAAGTTSTLTWNNLRPGTYLLESGTHPSIQATMGLYGILVVTQAPLQSAAATPASATTESGPGIAYPSVSYDAEVPLVFGEIDPVQNNEVATAVGKSGFSETAVWSGQPGGCGNPTSPTYQTCYPPVVNYTPLYYLINGVGFSKSSAATSLFPVTPNMLAPASGPGTVLVRMVNAGSRMHVPSIVGATTGLATPAVGGFSLIAEDGNPLPGVHRVQSEVFLSAGKTYDVMINAPPAAVPGATPTPALAVFDRELSLSANATARDSGMLAYLSINGSGLPNAPTFSGAVANADTYNSVVPGEALTISDPSKGVIANDVNVFGVAIKTPPANGTLTLNANGTFTYTPKAGWTGPDTFTYQANGNGPVAVVTLNAAPVESAAGITVANITYTANTATHIKIAPPGVLSVDKDGNGYPLSVAMSSVTPLGGLNLTMDAKGGFSASVSTPGTYSFTYKAQNAQGTVSSNAATVTLIFPQGSGLNVSVVDGGTKAPLAGQDYRWIIEEDKTFYVDPTKTTNTGTPGSTSVLTYGTNFHTSHMDVVAQGCTGPLSCESGQTVLGKPAVCDVGNGLCRTTASQETAVLPSQVVLDPTKRYYISVLPGDAANAFVSGNMTSSCGTFKLGTNPNASTCGHGMGGAPIAANLNGGNPVQVLVQPNPYPPGQLSVFVFEDDFPLNGEQDAGGGVDVLATNEPGLGGFQIHLWDAMGGNGDFTGQMTYDMFNQPLTNSLDGTMDPVSGFNACPISAASKGVNTATGQANTTNSSGITGMIVTCPKYESDGSTLSPLAGQALIKNLMPGRFGVIATPAADRIARGEEWHQTNTLDGQKAHDSFIRIGEPSYFQEFGPAGYHVTIGFANPAIINSRHAGVCNNKDLYLSLPNDAKCTNTVTGKVTTERMSRTPDERLYSSGSHDSFYWTQCYASLGDPDGEDFMFTKCDPQGNFTFTGVPGGDWRVTVFDQWNDMLVDGLSTPVGLANSANGQTVSLGDVAENQWQSNIYTRTFIDSNKDGVSQASEGGIPLVPVAVRYRDGSLANGLTTDFNGTANFNETFPLFNWYVVETDTTRYKNTGTHVVYDAGGPADGSASCGQNGYPACGGSTIGNLLANTAEKTPLPSSLYVPGSVYCGGADCTGHTILAGTASSDTGSLSTGRIDNPWTGGTEGWQGFSGQNNFIEFGKEPYVPGETGGIKGHVVYASTRPFDDPQLLVQTQWEPLVPHVTVNLYKEGTAPDGSTSLTLVDTTQTSSFDDYAQGFRADGVTPNMNCPGQVTSDLFYFTLFNQPNYLNVYAAAHGGPAAPPLPYNSQFKCYDGMHNWNQVQPAPYDGMYSFPSVTATDSNGKPTLAGTNCTVCTANTVVPSTDLYYGTPMLPAGKYVVEVVPPKDFEIVKEEDKNILIGDNFIAPVTQEFGALGNVFILPDQAEVASAYNANNAQNPTDSLGATPLNGIVPGFIPDPVWPCVGESRVVPDYISLFPQSKQVAPFAGATRNLCDRKEVTLSDQTAAIAKFYIFTDTHIASKFTGGITDDFTSEFDPFSPQYGEKFAPPNMPISVKDWTGAEISRVYSDQWGTYDGMTYSTWEVNPPNPTGYSPKMMVFCMNDPGSGTTPDPLYNPGYSDFCYELPYMPGQTQYLDTPVVPTSAFSAGYNHPDCAYPDATPAIAEVDGDKGKGPWASAPGVTLTITALGNQNVTNYAYSGPSATSSPFNAKTVSRHYGFGGTQGTVTIGGVNAQITNWSDTSISVVVPATGGPNGIQACPVQQQAQYGGSTAYCGELVITTAAGKQSVDAVNVTVGGKAPTYVSSTAPLTQSGPGAIQQAINAAKPGDLIMVPPGTYNEMLIMWKPVRLQGVGAASSIINANTQPAGKLDPWRAQMQCLFGVGSDGTPSSWSAACGSSWFGFKAQPQNPQVDRLPLEGILGWDTTVNGNLAQLLQEPTLLGAYEGAGITVVSKGVNTHGANGYFGSGSEATFPTGSTVLGSGILDCGASINLIVTTLTDPNPYPSNFQCNPSAIDGLTVTNSSQGGGGIFVHAWGHNLQIANNRVYGNIGTLSGGINIGQGESPDAYLQGTAADSDPGSCQTAPNANQQLPYCFNLNVNVHHNMVTSNTSIGDELFSGTPAGAGGVALCTGADYYKFQYNWICGNQSTGDGGGVAHIGYSWNGDIEHNTIIFNQSVNPTIQTNGGGLIVMGAAPDGFVPGTTTECGGTAADADCPPGLPDGTGPNLVINANLFLGNAAESGSGGGLRLQSVNGTELAFFPSQPGLWNSVSITNNIIANNVAGWDGAGVSMQDALAVKFINNTVMSNDTTASSGVLFNTLGAPDASAPNATNQTSSSTTSAPQPAGLVVMPNSPNLTQSIQGTPLTCLPGNTAPGTSTVGGSCNSVSYPYLANDVFWQNRAFYIGVGGLNPQYQQNVVTLYNAFTNVQPVTQPSADASASNGNGLIITGGTGACVAGSSYWDIGIRGDSGPANKSLGFALAPVYSVIDDAGDYPGLNNTNSNPAVLSQYCNGSRTPPELSATGYNGYNVPPGISDATVPNPIFNLSPAATVDEGNNWVNMTWGPLTEVQPITGTLLANYGPSAGSPVIGYITPAAGTPYTSAPSTDFYGNPRKTPTSPNVDAGAVEYVPVPMAIASVTPTALTFTPSIGDGSTSAAQIVTLHNTGNANLTGITVTLSSNFARLSPAPATECGTVLASNAAANATCTISIVFAPVAPATGAITGTATVTANVAVTGSPVHLTGTAVPPVMTASVTPTSLTFTGVIATTTSGVQNVTVTNTGNTALTGGTFTFGNAVFTRSTTAPGSCGTTLALGASCTIGVVFSPAAAGTTTSNLVVAFVGATVTPASVALSGTGVAVVKTATLLPATWTVSQARNCPGTGLLGPIACAADPSQVFTLTNTGNVALTGITQGVLGGTALNIAEYKINYLLSTCGPANNGQLVSNTTLAPGGTCVVRVQFQPQTSQSTGLKSATISVTDSVGTQSATLNGTAQ